MSIVLKLGLGVQMTSSPMGRERETIKYNSNSISLCINSSLSVHQGLIYLINHKCATGNPSNVR